jgi:phage N-6-adenine-methyltransferase
MLTSDRDSWETPPEIFERCNAEFRFDLDVCATPDNAKCERYYTPEMDGLAQEWRGRCWMNPPYGRAIWRWMQKAYEAAQTTADVVVCLVPARTDTAWWHQWAMRGEIRFLRKRVRDGLAAWKTTARNGRGAIRRGVVPYDDRPRPGAVSG